MSSPSPVLPPPLADAPPAVVPTSPYVLGLGKLVRRLPAVLPAGLFLAIAWLDLGTGLNVPTMFWEPRSALTLAASGFAITLLFAYTWTVTYVLDVTFDRSAVAETMLRRPRRLPRELIELLLPHDRTAAHTHGQSLRWYLAVTFLPATLLLALAAVFKLSGQFPYVLFTIGDRWPFLVGIGGAAVGLRLLTRAGQRVNRHWARVTAVIPVLGRVQTSEDRWVRATVEGVFVVQLGAFLAAAGLVWAEAALVPSVVAVCMLFGLLAGVAGVIWYHARRVALLAFAGLIALGYWAGNTPYKLSLPGLEEEYAATRALTADDRDGPFDLGRFEPPGPLPADDNEARREFDRVRGLTRSYLDMLPDGGPEQARLTDELNRLTGGAPGELRAKYGSLRLLYAQAMVAVTDEEEKVLERWKGHAAAAAGTGKPKLILVTVTGGANRSAVWTAKVLHELHQLPGFTAQLRLVSGASGGMVGATYHVASLKDGRLPDGYRPADVGQDYLRPLLNSLVFQEVPRLFWPTPYTRDRGHLLDLGLEGQMPVADADVLGRLAVFRQTFAALKQDEDAGRRPSLVYTPMQAEDGRRLFISNRRLPYLTVTSGNFLMEPREPAPAGPSADPSVESTRGKQVRPDEAAEVCKLTTGDDLSPAADPPVGGSPPAEDPTDIYSRSGVEFFHLFPRARSRFRLSTAARLNATFPYVSPAVALPTRPPRRVVDAGYYDNYGVSVAAGFAERWKRWAADNTGGVLVVQIRDSASQYTRRHLQTAAEAAGRAPPADPLFWLTGPLAAVDKARQSTTSFRNDEQLQQLHQWFRRQKDLRPDFFQTVVFERYTNVGLSWYLSERDVGEILNSWTGPPPDGGTNRNIPAFQALKQWLAAP